MPRFSVIVPAFNAAKTIEATLRSVLAQTTSDLELIVVDDGSADETPSLIASIAATDDRVELIAQSNLGTAGARNTGIARASADYVSFLDNDDLWMPGYLQAMGQALDAAPDAGFAYCDAWTLVDANLRLRRRTELECRPGPSPDASWEEIFVTLATRNFVMSSVTTRADALAENGGFDRTIAGTDDYDLWFRVLQSGRTAVRARASPLLLQRDRGDSLSKNNVLMLEGLRLVLERVLADSRTPAAAARVLEERLHTTELAIERSAERDRVSQGVAALRACARQLAERVLPGGVLYAKTPPEVAAAFPELARGRP